MSGEVSEHKIKNKRKKNSKQSEVGCWNCFTSEDGDKDVIDVEPIPLPKVREEHREKLKVYSFLASELSKPKAVSLKQKISEPYKVGKRIDAEILKHQSNIPVSVSEQFISAKSYYQESPLNISNTVKDCNSQINNNNVVPKSNILNYSKPQLEQSSNTNTPLVTPRTRRKIKALDISGVSYVFPHDEPKLSESIPRINKISENISETIKPTKYHTVSTYFIGKSVKDNDRSKEIFDATAVLNKRKETDTFTSSSLRKPVENENISKKYHSYTDFASLRTLPLQRKTRSVIPPISKAISDELKPIDEKNENVKYYNSIVFKTKELEKFNPPPLRKMVESKTTSSLSQLQISNEQTQNDITVTKRNEDLNKKCIYPDYKQSSVSPVSFTKTTQYNLPVKGNDFENNPAPAYSPREKYGNSLDNPLQKYPNEVVTLKSSHDDINSKNTFADNDKIVHEVHIATSTPQERCLVVNKVYEDTIKSGLNLSEAKEENMINSDKIDNTSSNGSESGYTGSLATVQEFVIDENQEESEEIEKVEKVFKDTINKTFASSLSSLPTMNKKLPTHSSSLSSGMNSLGNTLPAKSLRWSTLAKVPRSVSFEDEVYMSEAVSAGHATLPRRSNSPLPHDRDMDRDRFPLNRSGLQGRSESMASVYSGAGEGLRGSVTVKGEVQFSLLYNYRLGALEVGVKRCRDLAPIDVKRNRSDPYVKVYLLPDKSKAGKRKTKVKKNTLNPVFEETLSFVQPLASLSARTLWLSVWHADMFGRNDFLGEVTLPLADVVFDDPAPMWYKLHERTEQFDEQHGSRGDLIIGLKFELQDAARGKGTLHVLVKEAKNLVATKPNGLADVFCKSYLLPERGRLAKQKTTVVRRSLNPRWEHTFTYRGLTVQELASRALELSLWDRDRLASNDFMGAVRLSLATGTYMGASVNWMDSVGKEITLWQNMMQQPNLWVEGSLPLRPQLIN